MTPDDLDIAFRYFRDRDLPAEWVDMPHQGRTLHVSDPIGTPLELCATMETRPRLHINFEQYQGAHAQRLDHYQVLSPDVYGLCEFYSALGFRNSEYLEHGDELIGAFMYRKGTCLDLAIVAGDGPQLHHFAYTVSESRTSSPPTAGIYGHGDGVERGPGRHGPGGMLFTYLRTDGIGGGLQQPLPDHRHRDRTGPLDAASVSTNARWGRWRWSSGIIPAFQDTALKSSAVAGADDARNNTAGPLITPTCTEEPPHHVPSFLSVPRDCRRRG